MKENIVDRVHINEHNFQFMSRSQMNRKKVERRKRLAKILTDKVWTFAKRQDDRMKAQKSGLDWEGYIDYNFLTLEEFVAKHWKKANLFINIIIKW